MMIGGAGLWLSDRVQASIQEQESLALPGQRRRITFWPVEKVDDKNRKDEKRKEES
jgi:hypothetical protein